MDNASLISLKVFICFAHLSENYMLGNVPLSEILSSGHYHFFSELFSIYYDTGCFPMCAYVLKRNVTSLESVSQDLVMRYRMKYKVYHLYCIYTVQLLQIKRLNTKGSSDCNIYNHSTQMQDNFVDFSF